MQLPTRTKVVMFSLPSASRSAIRQRAPTINQALTASSSITHTRHQWFTPTTTRRAESSSSNNPPTYTFKLPQLSPSFTGGTLTKWYVQPEQALSINDLICDITTNTLTEDSSLKQVVQLESQEEGQVVKHLVDVGGDIKLGEPLLELETEDDMSNRQYAWQAYVKKDKK